MAAALKFLTLMNPPRYKHMKTRTRRSVRRARSGRFVATRTVRRSARRSVSRARRNPPKMTPAMRKKISLAVKRANRLRAQNVKRSRPARRTTVVVRRASRPSFAVARPARRNMARRSGGSGSILKSGKGILGMVSKDTLMIAGGAVAASFGTGIILNKFGSKLPGMTSANPKTQEIARAAYSVAIPLGAAYLLRNKQRRLAEGLVIGGLIMGFNSLLRTFAPTTTVVQQGAMGNFYETSAARGMGLAGEVPLGLGEYVQGANPGTLAGSLNTQAFATDAW